jgi:hypothetical protein
MKKLRFCLYPLVAALVVLISSLLTYRVFSAYQAPSSTEDPNPTYTLKLPDQEYTISARDLDTSNQTYP